jgi:hypothetical protein
MPVPKASQPISLRRRKEPHASACYGAEAVSGGDLKVSRTSMRAACASGCRWKAASACNQGSFQCA